MTSKGPRASVDLAAASAIGSAAGKLSKGIKTPKKPKAGKKPKEEKQSKTPAKKTAAKTDIVTKGPNATHARSADTGRAVKLKPEARAAVRKHETNRIAAQAPTTPAVDLTGPQFR